MDKEEANIDLLFRNGLKDYEVLPPADVWNNIAPVIRKRSSYFIILRAAATIAVLITLGILAYTWNDQASRQIITSSWEDLVPETQIAYTPEPFFLADAGSGSGQDLTPSVLTFQKQETPDLPSTETALNITVRENPATYNPPDRSSYKTDIVFGRQPGLIALSQRAEANLEIGELTPVLISDQITSDKTDRWTVAALMSPTYLSSFGTVSGETAKQIRSAEQPIVSYAGGIALSYRLGKRVSVQSGLYYSSYENQLSGISTFGGFTQYGQAKGNTNFILQTSNGMVSISNPDVYLVDNISDNRLQSLYDKSSFDFVKSSLEYLGNSLQQNMSYLELPVFVRYKLVDRALDFNIVGGISSNLLVNNSVYASLDGGKLQVAETEDLRYLTFSSSIGMGFEYNLGRGVSFNLEPTFRYYINPYYGSGSVNVHPYSIGVFSGLSYKF
ncbi:MAG: outer membrane beta-barrel protein [Bacteroidales bacterium]|nr:outer membrane beta-barrel protein [Bacteroidales bacterium]MBN2633082.1 outer membrane beta-barrel protein [Bacteroidales bacterium]